MLQSLKSRWLQGPIAISTIRTTSVMGLRLVAQTGILLLLTRLLGADHFGLFAATASLALLLGTLATFGTHFTLLRDVARSPDARNHVLPESLGTTIVLGILLFGVHLVLANTLFTLNTTTIWPVICLGLSETLFQPLLVISAMERQGNGRVALAQLYIVLPLLLRLGFVTVLFISRPGDALFAYSIGYVVITTTALAISHLRLPEPWPHPRSWHLMPPGRLKNQATFAFQQLTNRGPGELDKIVSSQLLLMSATGHYAAASRVIGALVTPVSAMMMSALPELFRKTENSVTTRLNLTLFSVSLAYGLLSATAIYLTAPIFPIIFGEQYPQIETFVVWMAVSAPAATLRLSGCNTLMASGHPGLRITTELSGLIAMALFAPVLVALDPIAGMPLAYATGLYITGIASWSYLFFARSASTENDAQPDE